VKDRAATNPIKYQPWLSPFNPQVLGTLRGKINQFTDGNGTILTPKTVPTSTQAPFTYITG
jgi:hypothetical protein